MLGAWYLWRMVVVIARVPMIGWVRPPPAETCPASDEISTLSFRVISLLWCTRGSMSMLIPTFWYVNEVIGTPTVPPTVGAALNVVVGIGIRSPMRTVAFSPSVTRTWGLAITWASASVLRKFTTTPGIGPMR